jgi:hypothetical protein
VFNFSEVFTDRTPHHTDTHSVCNAAEKSYRCWEGVVYWLLATKVSVKVLIILLNTTYRSSTLVVIKHCDIFRLS